MPICDKCDRLCDTSENEYGEFICSSCLSNAEEAAYERHIASFHDGGSTMWKTLEQQMEEARKLK